MVNRISGSVGKRVNILLKPDAHTKAKLIAVIKEITLNEYFEKAINESIERDSSLLKKFSK